MQMKAYAPTFLTEFTVMASQIVVYKLAAYFFTRDSFSEYAVARRTISLLYPPILLGLGVALPRYAGHANGVSNPQRSLRYYGAALRSVALTAFLATVLLNLFKRSVAYLFFGGKDYTDLVFPLTLVIFGLTLHSLVYSYFRGNLLMKQANCIQLINLGFVPLASFSLFRTSLRQVLMSLGLLTIGTAIVGLFFTPWREIARKTSHEMKELLRYGLQRVPGDFAHMALLALPVTFAAHLSGVREAGNLAFGISFLSIIVAFLTPIGLILLPKASGMLAAGEREELRKHVSMLVRVSLVISGATAAGFILLAKPMIKLYLGPGYMDIAWVIRILVLGAVPYGLFLVLRNVIDAAHENAITTLILAAGFLIFCTGAAMSFIFAGGVLMIILSLLAGLMVLGVLASQQTLKILHP
jgi:O-antigen/teichoic acid export membrane protein